jgi:hypothetical protein
MKKDTRFQDFLAEFTELAQDSETNVSEWKNELYRRLNFEMQTALMEEADNDRLGWAGFVDTCHKRANRIEQINLAKERVRQRSNTPRGGANRSSGRPAALAPSRGATPEGNRTGTGAGSNSNQLNAAARAMLMKDGKCFKCFQTGHLSRDCPTNDNAPAKNAGRPQHATELKKLEKDDNVGSESESENDEA